MNLLKDLYEKYNLDKDDFFKHKHYVIIKRQGIDKIQASAKISIRYELLYHSEDLSHAIVKAIAQMGSQSIETFGEVSPKNNKNAYPIAMAEKRAMSRAVLKLAGFYQEGVFAEDEFEHDQEASSEELTPDHPNWEAAIEKLRLGARTISNITSVYQVSQKNIDKLETLAADES